MNDGGLSAPALSIMRGSVHPKRYEGGLTPANNTHRHAAIAWQVFNDTLKIRHRTDALTIDHGNNITADHARHGRRTTIHISDNNALLAALTGRDITDDEPQPIALTLCRRGVR